MTVEEEKKSFLMFTEWAPFFESATDEQAGDLIKGIFAYVKGEEPELKPATVPAYAFIVSQIDKNFEKWEEAKRQKKEAGRLGGLAKASRTKQNLAEPSRAKQNLAEPSINVNVNVNDNVSPNGDIKESTKEKAGKPPRVCFVPPTVEEVQAYCLERQNTVDPEAFVAFYNSNGWLVGKNKMKNWKSAVITWEKRQDKQTTSAQTDTGLTDWYKIAQEVEDEQRNNGASYVDIFAGIPATVREDVGG